MAHPPARSDAHRALRARSRAARRWTDRRDPNDVARLDLFDRSTFALHETAPEEHDERLTERVGVPCGASARLERHRAGRGPRRCSGIEEWVNAYRAGEPI